MKRWVFTILLFLLFGAIANLFCATLCGLMGQDWAVSLGDVRRAAPSEQGLLARVRAGEIPAVIDHRYSSFGYGESWVDLDVNGGSFDTFHLAVILRTGWPMRCFECDLWFADLRAPVVVRGGTLVDLAKLGLGERIVIHRPCGSGLAFNTAMWAGVFGLAFWTTFHFRELHRYRKGYCPRCGHDLRSRFDQCCPECGWNRQPEATA